ncbi:MAG: helix-turn-helix transcriptional regulator [Vicinamibacterales bacterium]
MTEQTPGSETAPLDYVAIVHNLRLPLVVFSGARVIYRNKAADRLALWLREHFATELVTVLRNHIDQMGAAREGRDTMTLVRLPEGSHLFIDVSPLDAGGRIVSIRAPGLELKAIAAHYRLSARELQVVEYVIRGHSNRTIAELMTLTTDTVKKHLTRVFDKIGVDSRTQLMSLVS